MKVGDAVYQDYQNILRFGVVQEVNHKEDSWSYAKIKWFGDTEYEQAMSCLVELRGGLYEDYALNEYRVDKIKVIDIPRLKRALSNILEFQQEVGQ